MVGDFETGSSERSICVVLCCIRFAVQGSMEEVWREFVRMNNVRIEQAIEDLSTPALDVTETASITRHKGLEGYNAVVCPIG